MKTPEEMAEEYTAKIADSHSVKAACEKAFLAGYKAAVPQWISVKTKLPNANQGWVTIYGANWGFRWMVQAGFYDVETNEWLSRLIRGDEEGYCALEAVTHWMPLPQPPKEEK